MLLVAAVLDYSGAGIYLLDHGDGESPYVCERNCGRPAVMVRRPNPNYSMDELNLDQFRSFVTAKGPC